VGLTAEATTFAWFGSQIFAWEKKTSEEYDVLVLLAKNFVPVRPAQPIVCPRCDVSFWSNVQARYHFEALMSCGGCCKQDGLVLHTMPSAFFLPDVVLQWLLRCQPDCPMDILGADSVPVFLRGVAKHMGSTHGDEVKQETTMIPSCSTLDGLLEAKGKHFWFVTKKKSAKLAKSKHFDKDRFVFYPELLHFAWFRPSRYWPKQCLDAFLKEMKSGFVKEGFVRGGLFGIAKSHCRYYLRAELILVRHHYTDKDSCYSFDSVTYS
jgi:hypothetical protein